VSEPLADQLDMTLRLASDRVLRAVTLRRQAAVAVLASAALSVVAAVEPNLPGDLLVLKEILNVGAISALLNDVARGKEPDEEQIAARIEALLPAGDALARLATGQQDLLRALTRQHSWQQQMLRLQEADQAAGAQLLAAFAEMTGDLAAIRDRLAETATAAQLAALTRLIRQEVLPRLEPSIRAGTIVAGDLVHGDKIGGDKVMGDKITRLEWTPPPPYRPPPPPAPGELPDPGPLPPGHRIPFGRNPLFTGREDELRDLAAHLLPDTEDERRDTRSEARSELVTHHSYLVTSGIGGVGKTQLAVEFAHRFGRFFHGVHWVSLENPDAVATEIALCGAAMALRPDFDALPPEAQTRLTLAAWSGPEARLLLFDNCEDPALLAQWRPKTGGARVLVTSRRGRWPRDAGVGVRPLGALGPDEATALLGQYVPATSDAPAAALAAIGDELGGLPLALHLAGSYLAYLLEMLGGDPAARADDLLARLRDPALLRHPALRGEGSDASPTGHDHDVGRAFALSYDRLLAAQDATAAQAEALLARAACLAPGAPFPVALPGAALDLPDGEAGERALAAAARRLTEVGLLERAGDGAYRLHRLVARFVAMVHDGTAVMAAARDAVEEAVIALAYKQNIAGDPRPLREWEIQLRHVTDAAFDREDNTGATLCINLGYYLLMSGELAAARPYYERALAIRERVLGPDHPATARSLNNLGYLLQAMGELAAARPYYERALAIRERVLGPDHPATAGSLNNLGGLLDSMGDLAAARPYFERALAIRERVLGPDHPATARSLNNLGALLQAMGDLSAARPYYERALEISERVLGPDHPDTAQSLNNLGYLLLAMGELAAARPYYERALEVRERVLGPDHPDTATSLNNMGALLDAIDEDEAALDYYRRALAIREKVLGPNHPDTANSLHNVGALLVELGRADEGRPLLERALAIYTTRLGPDHPSTRGTAAWLRGL